MFWRPIDKLAEWISDCLTYQWQKRLGVLSLLIGLAFLLYFPFSKEPPAIFLMSFLALVFGAAGIIAGVEAAVNADDNEDAGSS
jgi:uncharacterized membrane protein HdeD (DUF308 family)